MSTQKNLDEELERIDGNVNGLFAKVSSLNDRIDELETLLEDLQEEVDDAQDDATMALNIAAQTEESRAADGGPTKKTQARRMSRDQVIKATAEGVGSGAHTHSGKSANIVGSVEVKDVQRMAEPQTDLKWQTVVDAWKDLKKEWPCFEVQDDPKQLTVDPREIPHDLPRVVERSLDRDDLVKRLVDGYGELEG